MINLFKQDLSLAARLRRLLSRSTGGLSRWSQHPISRSQHTRSQHTRSQPTCLRPLRPLFALPLLLAPAAILLSFPEPAQAQVFRNFTPRFTATGRGNISIIGNTLISCQTGVGGCAAARATLGGGASNSGFPSRFVNVNPPPVVLPANRQNSSTATLTLPAGAQVVFAGLYWGAYLGTPNVTTPPNPAQVFIETPTSGGYISVTAQAADVDVGPIFNNQTAPYVAFAEIPTTLVPNTGGTFSVAGVEAFSDASVFPGVPVNNRYAGWGLVVVYVGLPAPTEFRNLTVYDGFAVVRGQNNNPVSTVNVDGFRTPPAPSAVLTDVGIISFEGDDNIVGPDQIQITDGPNPPTLPLANPLTDPFGGTDDFFNSTIQDGGALIPGRTPSFNDNFGFDIDVLRTIAPSPIGNESTEATVTITNNNRNAENFWFSTLTLAISTTEENLRLVKRITNITRDGTSLSGIDFSAFNDDPNDDDDNADGFSQLSPVGLLSLGDETPLESGDEIEYTIYFLSDGGGPVEDVQFCDPIPDGTTFVTDSFGGSIGIQLNEAGTVSTRTNASDTDSGTFSSVLAPLPTGNSCPDQTNPNGAVTVDLGDISSSTGSNFGFVRFRAQVN